MEGTLKETFVIPKTLSILFLTISVSMAMVVSAYIYIPLPFTPVPITLQTFFVLLAGVILKRYAGLSQIIYICMGMVGLPVFAQGITGLSRLFGPTGGYLIGFIGAAVFIGLFYTSDYLKGLVVLLLATVIIYLLGSVQLWFYTRASVSQVLVMGVVPFLPGDLLKLFVAHQLGYWIVKNKWLDISL